MTIDVPERNFADNLPWLLITKKSRYISDLSVDQLYK